MEGIATPKPQLVERESLLEDSVREEIERLIMLGELPSDWSQPRPATPMQMSREVDYTITPRSVYMSLSDHLGKELLDERLYRATFSDAQRRTRLVSAKPEAYIGPGEFQDWSQVENMMLAEVRGMSRSSVSPARIHRYNVKQVLDNSEFFVGFIYGGEEHEARDREIARVTQEEHGLPGPRIHYADMNTEFGPMIGVFLPDRRFYGGEGGTLRLPEPLLGPLHRAA